MKDALMQKIKSIPSPSAATAETSSQVSELTETNLVTEGQRRVRKSAAMLGLALSVGATGMFIHNQDDAVMAAESLNRDSALTTLPILGETDSNAAQTQVSVQPAPIVAEPSALSAINNPASPAPVVALANEPTTNTAIQQTQSALESNQASQTITTEPAPPVIKHQVKEGETLWEISHNYAIAPQAIASSNAIKADATLKVGQNLKIPTANGIVQEIKRQTTTTELASSYGIKPEQIKASVKVAPATQLTVGETVAISGEVDQLMQKRQETAIENLQQETQNLEQQLTTLPTTTNKTSVELADATIAANAHAPQLPNNASASTLQTETPIQVIFPEPPKLSLNPRQPSEASISNQQLPTPKPVAIPEVPGNLTTQPQEQQLASPQSQGIEIPIQPQATTPVTQPGVIANQPIEIPVIPPVSSSVKNTPQYSPTQRSTVTIPTSVTNNANNANLPITTGNTQAATPVPTLINVETPKPVVIAAAPVNVNSNQVYQVRRGDTLNTIARRYGISSQQLARANNINNPNLIKVNQPLTIPGQVTANRQPETLIPGTNPMAYSQNPYGSAVSPSTSAQPQYVSFNLNNPPSNIVSSVTTENNDSVTKLKTDLERMRQEYPQQTVLASNIATRSVATNNSAVPIAVNPEWQQDQQARVTTTNANQARFKPQTVAVAPVQPDSYNNIIQPDGGQMVSPELPPLAPADQYLPNSAGQFNGYIWPAKGVLTSRFGPRWGRMHKGIDIAAPIGTPIFAAASGEVISAGWNSGGYGNLVKIRHADGSITFYAHNSKLFVASGQYVEQGQQISAMGSTGRSTGPHLHFEVHPGGGAAVNPIAFLPAK